MFARETEEKYVEDENSPEVQYCRVSTDSDDQLESYRAQVAYYTDAIAKNPRWKLADIYADEGITGTMLKKRDNFNRMIARRGY